MQPSMKRNDCAPEGGPGSLCGRAEGLSARAEKVLHSGMKDLCSCQRKVILLSCGKPVSMEDSMRYRMALLPLLFWCCMVVPALGASQEAPAYVRAALTVPFEGRDALRLYLEPDEPLCRNAYGNEWASRCSVSPGRDGAPVAGVRLSPDIPGDWRWEGDRVLTFRPKTPWPAGTSFRVSLAGVPLPARAKLSREEVSFATPPLAASGLKGSLWIDPDLSGERAVTFDMTFTTPPDRAVLERDAVVEVSDASLRLGVPEFVWSGESSCLVRIRVLSLAEMPAAVTLSLPGVAGEVRAEGTGWKVPEGRGVAMQQVTVPGKRTLFTVNRADLETSRNEELAGEYRLTLETSLLVRPGDVAAALKAVALPRALDERAHSSTVWTAAPVIDGETLSRAVPVRVEALQGADEATGRMSFRVFAEPGSYVLFELPAGFGPSPDYALAGPWREVFQAAPFLPELDILQPGNVLALGGGRRLDIHSSGLTSIKWRVQRVLDSYLGLLAVLPSPFSSVNLPLDEVTDSMEGTLSLRRTEPGVPQFSVLDMTPFQKGGHGLMRLELTGMDGDEVKATAERFLLMTDLGMLVKKAADGRRDVFVCSLSRGEPVAGAVVRIIGANGQPVAEAVSDARGRAALPSVSGLVREKRPVAVTALYRSGAGEDMAWLSLEDESRRVDVSRFPTQGQTSHADGVNAYVFSQRGIFRPGETLRFGILLRRGDWKALPADMPFFAELLDTAERTIVERRFTVGPDGLAEFSWAVPEGAPSGRYRLNVRTPDVQGVDVVLGSAAIRVEEFQPDTMELSLALAPRPGKGWLEASEAGVTATLRNLYGMPAADRRLRGQLSVWPAPLSFPGYEDFIFHDAAPYQGSPLTLNLAELRTDEAGRAVLPLPLESLRGGTLHGRVLVEGFEAGGGRSVTEELDFLVSPLRAVLGYRPTGTGGNLDFIPQGSTAGLEFVALGPELERVNPGKLTCQISARRYVTSLVSDSDGRFRYEETPVDSVIRAFSLSVDENGSLTLSLPTENSGEYLLTVRDGENRVMAQVPFTVAGNDDLRLAGRPLPSGTLRMHLESTELAAGEKARLFLSAPFDGTGLVTLERDGVAAWRWCTARAGDSVQEIDVPRDFEGRAYVHVALVRSLASKDVFMQPYVYAVAPVAVNVGRRDMALQVSVPSGPVLPGGVIHASVTSRVPGKALLFAVDEGVLRLTSFPTPDPLRYLLRDRALEVETRQMFDLLMPEHGSFRIPAFGGDMGMAGGRFHNPFKRKTEPPMSWWAGLVDVKAGDNPVEIPVPGYYSGTVRVMAVAASAEAAGSADARVEVCSPVVLTPQLPVLASPGDVFEAALAVANHTETELKAELSLESDRGLRVVEAPASSLSVAPGSEAVIPFRMQAEDVLGSAEVRFTVKGEGVEAFRTASLSVRPASALRGSVKTGSTSSSMVLEVGRSLYPYDAKGSASVSALPLPALRGLVRYLDSYPYGCVEQRISRAMPFALLMNRPGLLFDASRSPEETRRLVRERLDDAVRTIQGALQWRGVPLWPGGEPDLLVTAYAADFLLAMREAGAELPGGLLSDVCAALERALDRVPASLEEGRVQAYGLWVLTREGRITTQALSQLVNRMEDMFPGWREDVASSLVAACCAVMRMQEDAERFIAMYGSPGSGFRSDGAFDALAAQALRASVVARHFPGLLDNMRDSLAEELVDATGGGRYASFSAALAVRALLDVEKAVPVPAGVALQCTAMQSGFEESSFLSQELYGMLTLSAPGCAAYALTVPEGGEKLYYEVSSQGFDRMVPDTALAEGLEVTRSYLDAEGNAVTKVRQGDVVTVSVTARAHGGVVDDVAIVDMLPGGFEMELAVPAEGRDVPGAMRSDRREDRMIFFTSLGPEPSTFTYVVRAVNRGSYALPAVQAEAMYDRSMRAHGPGGRITVE